MRFIALLFLLLSNVVFAEIPHDILFKSRFDIKSSKSFIDHLRSFLISNKFGDPYQQKFDQPIDIDLAPLINDLPKNTQLWIQDLQSLLRLNIFDSKLKLVVEGLGYSLSDFNSEFLPITSERLDRVEYVTYNHVRGLRLSADKISFVVEITQAQVKEPLSFQVELIEPVFTLNSELSAELPMGWFTSILPENIKLTLHSVDIEKLFQAVLKQPHLVDFTTKEFILPDFSIKVGAKTVSLDKKKLKSFLQQSELQLKMSLLNILKSSTQVSLSNILRDSPQDLILPRVYGIADVINAAVEIDEMKANRSRMLELGIKGYLCKVPGSENEGCLERLTSVPKREISLDTFRRSSRLINRMLIENAANIALSMSENLINQLILSTIDLGLWEDAFKGKDLRLGPNAAFLLAEDSGNSFSLYLDIIHKLKGAQRVMVGRSEIRFPVRLKIALKIREIGDNPSFIIDVLEVATKEEHILAGFPEYGLISTVGNVPRFRSKVINSILEDISAFKDQTLISFEVPELKGSYFQKLNFFSDGMGRANATINFNSIE